MGIYLHLSILSLSIGMSCQCVSISFTLYWSNPAANFLFCGWKSGTGLGLHSTCFGTVILSCSDLFPDIFQWAAETWPAAMHLPSDWGSFCWLPRFSLCWSFHGEKLSSGNRMSVLDNKGLSSVRFPRDQRTEAGHSFNLALGRAKIEQTSDKLLELMSRPWTRIQLCHWFINVFRMQPGDGC